MVQLRPRPALRARIRSRELPGAHAKDSGDEIPQRDPAGQEVPPGPVILDSCGARAFGRPQEGLTVRSDVGKTDGPDGDSGYCEGSTGPALL
ncbi:MAG TPA: hypothetical protein VF885_21955 [Arthrobacter sp.]